jgi:uncharacterized membrane protein YGL010W
MDNELSFYKYYHQNPINKWIHFVCIPMIVLSILIFIDNFYILYENYYYKGRYRRTYYKFKLMNFVLIGLILSYFRLGFWIGLTMTFYFWVIGNLAGFMIVSINRDLLMTITKVMFVGGWILQFIGHYIEGRKPALLDSISKAFFQAPLFSLEVLLPGLFKN